MRTRVVRLSSDKRCEIAKSAEHMTSTPTKIRRILLVEDNSDDVFLFMRAISQDGQKVDVAVAGNAEEAINALVSSSPNAEALTLPDVVVTDLKMPGWTGIHLVSWIRSQPGFGALPIIVLSSSGEPIDVINAYEAGATSYLVKPNNFQGYRELVLQLRTFCLDPTRPLQGGFVKTLA